MNLKTTLFSIVLIALVALIGCDSAQKMVIDNMPVEPTLDEMPTDMETGPANLVWFIYYPERAWHEASNAYYQWLRSTIFEWHSVILHESEIPNETRIYQNNIEDTGPLWFLEFEFDSFLDAKAYMDHPDIMGLFNAVTDTTLDAKSYIFIERSDYEKQEQAFPNVIKGIILVEYHPGGKAAYLEWVASISDILVGPPELQAIASYDNASGEAPHRLVTLEFSSQEDATAYEELEEIMAIEAELDVRTASWSSHTFELQSGSTGRESAEAAEPETTPPETPKIDVDFSDIDRTIEFDSGLIAHYTAEEFKRQIAHWESKTFETAAEAIVSEEVLAYMESVKAWIQEHCWKGFSPVPPPAFSVIFRSEEERQKFFDAMPGTYATYDGFPPTADTVDKATWWTVGVGTAIVDEKPSYFFGDIDPFYPCENSPQ